MRNKYNAKKCFIAGIRFDSKKEAVRYTQLLLLQKAGKISELRLQVPFILQDSFSHWQFKRKILQIKYIADFTYRVDGILHVEDTKGYKTEVYKIKRKMFLNRYGNECKFIES